jgi:CYTH domain-containing protein
MSDVATGNELRRVQAEVAALQQRHRAVRVRVSHSALIVSIKGDRATVYDEQHDRSFLINPVTKEPHNGSVPPFLEKDIYYLQKVDGTWKIVKSLRQR